MCGGVNDSDGKKCISDNKTYFSLLLILLPLLFFDLCFGRTWAISLFVRWVVDTPHSTVGHLSIFSTQVGIYVPLILLRTLVHFYLSSHSFLFSFSRFRALAPFYFLTYFCITHVSSALNLLERENNNIWDSW